MSSIPSFITLTRDDGRPVTVNIARITNISPCNIWHRDAIGKPPDLYNGTVIMFGSTDGVYVREPFAHVAAALGHLFTAYDARISDLSPIQPQEAGV